VAARRPTSLPCCGVSASAARRLPRHSEMPGREELAAKEEFEAGVIATYLPAELSDEALIEIARAAVADSGASGPAESGRR